MGALTGLQIATGTILFDRPQEAEGRRSRNRKNNEQQTKRSLLAPVAIPKQKQTTQPMQHPGLNGQAPANPAATERLHRQHDQAVMAMMQYRQRLMQRQHAHPAQDYANQLQQQGYYSSNSTRVATNQHPQQHQQHPNEGFHNASSSSSAKRKWQEIGQASMPTNGMGMQRRPSPVTTVTLANALDTAAFPNHPAFTYGGNLPPPARIVAATSTAAPASHQSTAKATLKAMKTAIPKATRSTGASTGKSGSLTVASGLPTEVLGQGLEWPEGWTKITKKRMGGASAGSFDSYWISPKTKFRLRSMNEVRKFFKLLARCGGDEHKARREFKKKPMKAIAPNEKGSKKASKPSLKPPTASPLAKAAAIGAATAKNPPHSTPAAAASTMKNAQATAAAMVTATAKTPPHLTLAEATAAAIVAAAARNLPHLTPAAAALGASTMKNAAAGQVAATAATVTMETTTRQIAGDAASPSTNAAEANTATIENSKKSAETAATGAVSAAKKVGDAPQPAPASTNAAEASTATIENSKKLAQAATTGAVPAAKKVGDAPQPAPASTNAAEASTATIENCQNSAKAATVSAAKKVGDAPPSAPTIAPGDTGEATTTKNAPQSPSPQSSAQAKPSEAKPTENPNPKKHPNVPSALDEQKALLHAKARHHALFGPSKKYKRKGPKPAPPPFLSKEMLSPSKISMVSSDDIQFPHDHIVL